MDPQEIPAFDEHDDEFSDAWMKVIARA